MKSIVAPAARFRFPLNLICCIDFGSASRVSYLNLLVPSYNSF